MCRTLSRLWSQEFQWQSGASCENEFIIQPNDIQKVNLFNQTSCYKRRRVWATSNEFAVASAASWLATCSCRLRTRSLDSASCFAISSASCRLACSNELVTNRNLFIISKVSSIASRRKLADVKCVAADPELLCWAASTSQQFVSCESRSHYTNHDSSVQADLWGNDLHVW